MSDWSEGGHRERVPESGSSYEQYGSMADQTVPVWACTARHLAGNKREPITGPEVSTAGQTTSLALLDRLDGRQAVEESFSQEGAE
jgi:hypothetical protein